MTFTDDELRTLQASLYDVRKLYEIDARAVRTSVADAALKLHLDRIRELLARLYAKGPR